MCALKTSWLNGSNRVYIDTQNPVYLDCLLTPGRVRTAGVTGDPSSQLAFPGTPWVTFFWPEDNLIFNVTNEAAYANTFQINMNGIWLKRGRSRRTTATCSPLNATLEEWACKA